MNDNLRAFLDMIAAAEGTKGRGQHDGYDVIVGGSTFHDFSRHPNLMVSIPRLGIKSTAAGRYQLLHRYWLAYTKRLGLKGFGPDVQDAIAVQQIRECGALGDVAAGRPAAAIMKCNRIWASLPRSPYGQGGKSMDWCLKKYAEFGGKTSW